MDRHCGCLRALPEPCGPRAARGLWTSVSRPRGETRPPPPPSSDYSGESRTAADSNRGSRISSSSSDGRRQGKPPPGMRFVGAMSSCCFSRTKEGLSRTDGRDGRWTKFTTKITSGPAVSLETRVGEDHDLRSFYK